MEKLFFDKLVELKNDGIDFIISETTNGKVSGGINVNIKPTENFVINRIEFDSGGLYVDLNGNPTKIQELSREQVIMIAAYLDGSWDGL